MRAEVFFYVKVYLYLYTSDIGKQTNEEIGSSDNVITSHNRKIRPITRNLRRRTPIRCCCDRDPTPV